MNPEHERRRLDIEARLFAAEIGGSVPEVDLHGMDREDALLEVESLIQQAFMNSEKVVRIITGHGTGTLRKAIQDLLRNHPLVETFRDSTQPGHVGSVTVVAVAAR